MFWENRPVLLSRDAGKRVLFVRPPQPPAEMLFSPEGIWVAKTVLWNVPFCWDFKRLANPHVAVFGLSGSGKSYFVKSFLTKAGLQWGTKSLILDWSGEYGEWVRQCGGTVVRLGDDALNILDLGGMTPLSRSRQVVESVSMLAEIQDPVQKQWLLLALENAYTARGFRLDEESASRPPTLGDALLWLSRKSRSRPAVENLSLMLRFLCAGGGGFFARQSSVSLEDLFAGTLACVDLTGLQNDAARSLAGLAVLQYARERMRKNKALDGRALERFIVLDEAWKICGQDADPSVIVREGRKHAFGLLVATQNPQDVSKTITSQAGSIFVFRTTFAGSLDFLQGSLNFGCGARASIAGLKVGECGVHLLWESGPSPFFFLRRVEGEELLARCTFEVKGMVFAVEKNILLSYMQKAGLRAERADEWLCSRGYKADLAAFCAFLASEGLDEENQGLILDKIGLGQDQLRAVFSSRRRNKASGRVRWGRVCLK